ncbi:MAG TPA: aldose 1-epimerase [Dictyobacter sp.]|jgi:aldose 1-epimerase|nr:aldose 1-epimerase [Dictyobacter sp.]
MTAKQKTGPFSAEISKDSELQSTVVSLTYEDQQDPSHSMIVSIAPDLGSNLFRFRVGEHDLIYCEQNLLKQMAFTGNFVLWPFPNRVRDKRYTYQGKAYSLAQRKVPAGNEVLIHGLVFDRSWQHEPPNIQADQVSVTTYVDMLPGSPLYASYPFDSRLALTYTLTRTGLSITYLVQNRGKQTLPFGFALHPYFKVLTTADQTQVSIPAQTVMEADNDLLPTGRLLDVTSTMYEIFNLRESTPISHLKLDHVYTDMDASIPAVIEYHPLGLQLVISGSDDFTHAVLYTPPPPDTGSFFCLEYQTCSTDAINFHNQDAEHQRMAHLLEVPPDGSASGSLHYTVRFP